MKDYMEKQNKKKKVVRNIYVISTRKTGFLYVQAHHHLYLIVKFESSYEIQKLSLVAIDVDRQVNVCHV